MAGKNTLRLYVTADGKVAVRTFDEVGAASDRTAAKVEKDAERQTSSFKKIEAGTHHLRGAAGMLAGTVGLGGLAFGIKDVVEAGIKLQQQQSLLQNSLKTTGQYSERTMRMVEASASGLATHGGFSDPAQLQAITNFVRLTGSATRAVQANREATNLARGTGLGYSLAQRMISQALTGTTGRLQRYLGVIQPVKTAQYALSQAHGANVLQLEAQSKALGKLGPLWLKQQEIAHNLTPQMVQHAQLLDKQATAQKVLGLVQAKYGTATQAFARTTGGAISNLKNSWEQLQAGIGTKVLPVLSTVIKFLDRNKTAAVIVAGVLIGLGVAFKVVTLATRLWATATTVGGAAVTAVTAIIGFLTPSAWGLSVAMDVLAGASAAAWIAMTGGLILVVAAIVLVITHFKTFESVVGAVWNWLKGAVGSVVNFIKAHWQLLVSILGGPFVALGLFVATHFSQVKHVVENVVGFIGKIFSKVFHVLSWPFVEAWNIIKDIIGKVEGAIKGIVGIPGKIIGGIGHFISHPFGLHTGGIVPHMADGGLLGGYGGGDKVPRWLEPGEGVLRKEAVQGIGPQAFNAINATGTLPGASVGSPGEVYVTAPIRVEAGGRVLTEVVVHTAAIKAAASGHYASG